MRFVVLGLCIFAFALNSGAVRAGNLLIKPEEGALPTSDRAKDQVVTRAITRRPDLILVSPTKGVDSPFDFQFRFRAHGGSGIKPDSFQLIYLKKPAVNLTARVRPFVKATGLDMPQAEAPPGRHVIEARISDSDGRETTSVFVLEVIK